MPIVGSSGARISSYCAEPAEFPKPHLLGTYNNLGHKTAFSTLPPAPTKPCAPEQHSGQKKEGRGLRHDLDRSQLGEHDPHRVVAPEVHRGRHLTVILIE